MSQNHNKMDAETATDVDKENSVVNQDNQQQDQKMLREKESPEPEINKKEKKSFHSQKINNQKIMESGMQETKNNQVVTPVVVKQGGKGIAFGALVLSLIALGCSGFLFVEGQNTIKTIDLAVDQKLNNAAEGQSKNGVLLAQSMTEQSVLKQQNQSIETTLQDINSRYDRLEKAYQDLTSSRAKWLIDETEYVLNILAQQLLFSGDVQVTTQALETLEKRLNRFNHPELLPLKQAISMDLSELKKQSYVDVVSAALRLDRLGTAVETMPLLLDSMISTTTSKNNTSDIGSQENSWYQKLWQDVRENLNHLVEVRKIDNKDAMLISPDQAYFLRQNIKLRLLSARIALLQHQDEIYRNELMNLNNTVSQYFDKNNIATQAWLKEIEELKDLSIITPQSEPLKNSIAAISQFRGEQLNVEALPKTEEQAKTDSIIEQSIASQETISNQQKINSMAEQGNTKTEIAAKSASQKQEKPTIQGADK